MQTAQNCRAPDDVLGGDAVAVLIRRRRRLKRYRDAGTKTHVRPAVVEVRDPGFEDELQMTLIQLSAPQGLNHFLSARASAAEVIVLDPLYSTHDQDENDTRALAALCQACSACAKLRAPR